MSRLRKIKKRLRQTQAQPQSREPEVVELDLQELRELIDRLKANMSDTEYEKLCSALDALNVVGCELDKKKASIQRLRQMLFGEKTEKTGKVFKGKDGAKDGKKDHASEDGQAKKDDSALEENKPDKPAPGHGRNGADRFTGAPKTVIRHPELKAGDTCPDCKKGTVYTHKPARIVRISGCAPLQASVYELEKLRCSLCGKIFSAPAPEEVGQDKYDAASATMIALLKYGSGVPFNRLEGLQGNLGIPLPASTQWEIVRDVSEGLDPVYRQLIHEAAQGQLLHHDDTTMKILNVPPQAPGRKGIFTSGIVSVREDGRRIALFFTGQKHAGENLTELLRRRNELLDKPLQMCDALSRNMPEGLKTIVGNCLAHGRRRFVEVANSFPDECLLVLNLLKDVYRCDDATKGMSDQERLAYHQANSGPKMQDLHDWLNEQIDEHRIEPNSSLGEAMGYMLKHWEKLTLFLREPGAPLDNNICERALKKVILNRKNAYFYRTENGARVGDLYMSLIHTCELNQVNPFEYLSELQKNQTAIAAEPAHWLPWNYRENLQNKPQA